ncbi:MAG: hypothetical protein Phyf2KO_14380 [Phycisphaerales bacterium]
MGTINYKILEATDRSVFAQVAPGTFDFPLQSDLIDEFLADPRHHMAVAIDDCAVVGVVSAVTYIHPDKPLHCWINEVSTAPSHRRQGIARRLVDNLVKHLKDLGCGEIWLATEVDNEPARALYRAAGAKETPIVMYSFD